MQLERLQGKEYTTETMISGRVQLARIAQNGRWMALNFVSECPTHLRNRQERATWALVQGIKVKDVEAYVRKEKRRIAQEGLDDALNSAKKLLVDHGFKVVLPEK